jgi:hypothetical protein
VLTVGVVTYYFIVDLPEILIPLEFEWIFSFFYALSYVILPCSAFLKLQSVPEWFTPTRKRWVMRIRIGTLLLTIYGVLQTIKAFQGIDPEFRTFLFILNMVLLCLAIVTMYSGLPEVSEWFFDEIKIRSAPEMKELKPAVSLERLWQLIDTWEEEKVVPKEKMNETDITSYVQEALGTLKTY